MAWSGQTVAAVAGRRLSEGLDFLGDGEITSNHLFIE